jgi:hypothetical protein
VTVDVGAATSITGEGDNDTNPEVTVDVGAATSITTVAVEVTAPVDAVTADVATLSITTVGLDTSALLGVGTCPVGCGAGVSVASGAIA